MLMIVIETRHCYDEKKRKTKWVCSNLFPSEKDSQISAEKLQIVVVVNGDRIFIPTGKSIFLLKILILIKFKLKLYLNN